MKNQHTNMHRLTLSSVALAVMGAGFCGQALAASGLDEWGTTKLDFNLRYASIEQDNTRRDADALTLRTRLTYATKSFSGFSAVVEFEDSRKVLGVDDFNDTVGNNPDFSVVADPETTELDQAYVQYQQKGFTAKVGRQVIALDAQRFIGHVGWRQDRQTFDAATFAYRFNKDVKAQYGYINKRNRLFAEERDLDSKDHLLNLSYKTALGKLVAYGYLLEVDNGTENSLDTWGVSFKGKKKLGSTAFLYDAEIATQSSETATTDFDALYTRLEVGAVVQGITAKVGLESLGSDDGAYGFSTPLATLHKFNGWSDQFLGTPNVGLDDVYVKFTGKALGGKWLVAYHDFSAEDGTPTVDDLGSEVNLQYTRKFADHYRFGFKYANYSAGDTDAGKVDTDKAWLWVGASF